MRNRILLIFGLLLFAFGVQAQKSSKVETVTIKSSIQCGMCEDRLTDMFAEYWAVKEVNFNVPEQLITVKYNKKKTSVEEIRLKIAETGYDADDVEAVTKAYNQLPGCCKKGAHIPERK